MKRKSIIALPVAPALSVPALVMFNNFIYGIPQRDVCIKQISEK